MTGHFGPLSPQALFATLFLSPRWEVPLGATAMLSWVRLVMLWSLDQHYSTPQFRWDLCIFYVYLHTDPAAAKADKGVLRSKHLKILEKGKLEQFCKAMRQDL
jgi:hypothetical protein